MAGEPVLLYLESVCAFPAISGGSEEMVFTPHAEDWALLVQFGAYLTSDHHIRDFWTSRNLCKVPSHCMERLHTSPMHNDYR